MRDEQDCAENADMTLTGRIGRIEKILDVNRDPYGNTGQRKTTFDVHNYTDRAARNFEIDEQRYVEAIKDRQACDAGYAFEAILDRIHRSTKRVYDSTERLEAIGTRIMGALPEAEAGSSASRAPDGTLQATFTALDWLGQALQRLEHAALRLEGL